MSYYLVVGGEKWTQVASVIGWRDFRSWVDGIGSDNADELRHLVEYGWSQKLPDLSEQLTESLSSGKPSADVKDIGQTVLTALADAPDGAESAVLTDGLTGIDDPDDSGWSSTEEEEGEPAEPDSGKGIESGDIETPEGIPPPLSRKAIEKAHVERVTAREEEASRDLARFFQGFVKNLSERVAKSGFKPDPSKDARKQAEAILKKAFDPKEHLKGLVRAIAPHLAASFCVGAGAELELTKQAAIRKKARGWTSTKDDPPEKETN